MAGYRWGNWGTESSGDTIRQSCFYSKDNSFRVNICLNSCFCEWKMSSRRGFSPFAPYDQNLSCQPGNDEWGLLFTVAWNKLMFQEFFMIKVNNWPWKKLSKKKEGKLPMWSNSNGILRPAAYIWAGLVVCLGCNFLLVFFFLLLPFNVCV